MTLLKALLHAAATTSIILVCQGAMCAVGLCGCALSATQLVLSWQSVLTWIDECLPSCLQQLLLHGQTIQLLHLKLNVCHGGPKLEAVGMFTPIWQL